MLHSSLDDANAGLIKKGADSSQSKAKLALSKRERK